MKKLLLTGLLGAALLFGGVAFGEGTKVVQHERIQVSITVPELAPEFLQWSGRLMLEQEFPLGTAILVEYRNPDLTVFVRAIWLIPTEENALAKILVFWVFYAESEVQEGYEDVGFFSGGPPTGVFNRVQDASKDYNEFIVKRLTSQTL